MSRKLKISALLALLLGAAGLTAHAGLKDPNTGVVNIVQYSDGSGYAIAEVGAVRASADTGAFFGCAASGYPLNTSYVQCKARNAAGVVATCWQGGVVNGVIQGTPMMQTLAAQSNDSQIEFYWDTTGKCSYLYVLTDSSFRPKSL